MNPENACLESVSAQFVLIGFGTWLLVMLIGVLTMAVFSFLDYRDQRKRNSTTDDP